MAELIFGLTGSLLSGIGWMMYKNSKIQKRLKAGRLTHPYSLSKPRCDILQEPELAHLHPSEHPFYCKNNIVQSLPKLKLGEYYLPETPKVAYSPLSILCAQSRTRLAFSKAENDIDSHLGICQGIGLEPLLSEIEAKTIRGNIEPVTSCTQRNGGKYKVTATQQDIDYLNDVYDSDLVFNGKFTLTCNNLEIQQVNRCHQYENLDSEGGCIAPSSICEIAPNGFRFQQDKTSFVECQSAKEVRHLCPKGEYVNAISLQCEKENPCENQTGIITVDGKPYNCDSNSITFGQEIICPDQYIFNYEEEMCLPPPCPNGGVKPIPTDILQYSTDLYVCRNGEWVIESGFDGDDGNIDKMWEDFLTKFNSTLTLEEISYLAQCVRPPNGWRAKIITETYEIRVSEPQDLKIEHDTIFLELNSTINIGGTSKIIATIYPRELVLVLTPGVGGWIPALDTKQKQYYEDSVLVTSDEHVKVLPHPYENASCTMQKSLHFLEKLLWYRAFPSITIETSGEITCSLNGISFLTDLFLPPRSERINLADSEHVSNTGESFHIVDEQKAKEVWSWFADHIMNTEGKCIIHPNDESDTVNPQLLPKYSFLLGLPYLGNKSLYIIGRNLTGTFLIAPSWILIDDVQSTSRESVSYSV